MSRSSVASVSLPLTGACAPPAASQHTTQHAGSLRPRSRPPQGRGPLSAIHLLPEAPDVLPWSSLLFTLLAFSSSPQGRPQGLWPQDSWGWTSQGRTSEESGEGSLGEGGRRGACGELPGALHSVCRPWRRADLSRVLKSGACFCVVFSELVFSVELL